MQAGKEKFIKTAKEHKIPVVSTSFVDNIRDVDYNIVDQIQLTSIADWIKPADVEPHLKSVNKDFSSASKGNASFVQEVFTSRTWEMHTQDWI